MNQHDQMLESLREFLVREMPAGTVIGDPEWWVPKIMKALAAEPSPLVRLTDDDVCLLAAQYLDITPSSSQIYDFANAIMGAMAEKNGG